MLRKFFLITFLSLVISNSYGQIFSRIEADFSLKEKRIDGSKSLTMGRVYYDKNAGQIVFDIKFPEKMVMVMNDTAMIQIKNNTVVSHNPANGMLYFTVFNLCLNGNLPYFWVKRYTLSNF